MKKIGLKYREYSRALSDVYIFLRKSFSVVEVLKEMAVFFVPTVTIILFMITMGEYVKESLIISTGILSIETAMICLTKAFDRNVKEKTEDREEFGYIFSDGDVIAVPISNHKIVIGRSKEADFCIENDDLVSKNHAIIFIDNNRIFIRDNHSLSGTYVNGEKLEGRHELVNGDEIGIGQSMLLYRDSISKE